MCNSCKEIPCRFSFEEESGSKWLRRRSSRRNRSNPPPPNPLPLPPVPSSSHRPITRVVSVASCSTKPLADHPSLLLLKSVYEKLSRKGFSNDQIEWALRSQGSMWILFFLRAVTSLLESVRNQIRCEYFISTQLEINFRPKNLIT